MCCVEKFNSGRTSSVAQGTNRQRSPIGFFSSGFYWLNYLYPVCKLKGFYLSQAGENLKRRVTNASCKVGTSPARGWGHLLLYAYTPLFKKKKKSCSFYLFITPGTLTKLGIHQVRIIILFWGFTHECGFPMAMATGFGYGRNSEGGGVKISDYLGIFWTLSCHRLKKLHTTSAIISECQ